tara:strand:+ start:1210 stop:1488 length:279 start_codon:yes stop_codon:yes gene_type:complete
MLKEVTNLVNDVILPAVESNDILGLTNLNDVKYWYLIDNNDSLLIALLHDAGILPTLVLTAGCIFAGSAHYFGVTENAERIKERIELSANAA